MILASIIAVAPLAYRINNSFVKWPVIIFCLIILLFSQIYVLPLFASLTNKLNFNFYVRNNYIFQYLPNTAYSFFDTNTSSGYFSINIFHGGVILYEAAYFALCLTSGSLLINKTRNRDDKSAKKFFALKLTALAVFFVFLISLVIGVNAMTLDKNAVYSNYRKIPGYHEQAYDNVVYCLTGDTVDLSGKLSFPAHPDTPKYKKGLIIMRPTGNTYYDKVTREYKRYKNTEILDMQKLPLFNDDFTSVYVSASASVLYCLFIENTYTNKKYYCGYIMIVSTPVPVDELEWVEATINN